VLKSQEGKQMSQGTLRTTALSPADTTNSSVHRPELGRCKVSTKMGSWVVHGGLVRLGAGVVRCVTCGMQVRVP